jgi:HSP20 family molecular chaperone IbpA
MSTVETSLHKQPSETPEGVERTSPVKVFIPRVDIVEAEDAIFVVADLPGVDETGVDITLEKNVLTLKATAAPQRPEGYSLAYAEYEVGNFERVFTVSDAIDRNAIEANVKNGVLRVKLPKSKQMLSQKIAVQAAQ